MFYDDNKKVHILLITYSVFGRKEVNEEMFSIFDDDDFYFVFVW